MNVRTLACMALGATIGLFAATWETWPGREALTPHLPAAEPPPARPSCCSETGTSRAALLGTGPSVCPPGVSDDGEDH